MNDRTAGGHILLGPTVNAQRSPLGGRSFESFSEDPHVNGTISATYINGLQSKDVAAAIKHYVANDQEFERSSISSEVSERALREIYLKPFQIAIHESKPWALTASYNRINGQHVSEDTRIVQDINILKAEWGLGGMTMSDWMGVYNTAESIKAELYLEMPSPPIVLTGSEVAQVCIADPQSTLPRPPKELEGFTKVAREPGDSKTVTVELGRDAISYYDHRAMHWVAEQGAFEVPVAASAEPVQLKVLEKTFTWTGL